MSGAFYASEATFVGLALPPEPPAPSMGVILIKVTSSELFIELENAYDATKLSLANVSIHESYGTKAALATSAVRAATLQDAIDHGYLGLNADAVVPKAIVIELNSQTAVLYNLKISKLAVPSGSFYEANATFVGLSAPIVSQLPEILSVVTLDNQTIKVYFDRDIYSNSILGPIYSYANTLVPQALMVKNNGEALVDLSTVLAYAIQDPKVSNALIIRVKPQNAFKAVNINSGLNGFGLIGDSTKFKESHNSAMFAPSEIVPTPIVALNVYAVNSEVIRVYFNQPAYGSLTAFANVGSAKTNADITLRNPVAIDSTHGIYEFTLSSPLAANVNYWLVANAAATTAIIGDAQYNTGTNSIVTLKDDDTTIAGTQQFVQFTGTSVAAADITAVAAVMLNDKTMKVYYPAIMDTTGATGSVLLPANYSIVNGSGDLVLMEGGASFNPDLHIIQIRYDSNDNSAIILFNKRIISPDTALFLKLSKTITNASGTQFVKNGNDSVITQFAMNTTEAPDVTVTGAVYSAVNGIITLNLSQGAKLQVPSMNKAELLISAFNLQVNWYMYSLIASDISNVLFKDEFGNEIADPNSDYFDKVEIQLSSQMRGLLMQGALGKVMIKTDSMIGINGNTEDTDEVVLFSH